jgi:hypothetical protein
MSAMTNLASPGRLVSGEIGVSEAQTARPYGGRWTSSNPCVNEARHSSVDFEQPKHTALLAGALTTVPTTGVPPSAAKRRT